MAALKSDAEIIERTLTEFSCRYPSSEKVRVLQAYDRERGQFLLIDEGWDGFKRTHLVWAHIELRDDKLWVHEDGTEEGITHWLVAADIPRDRIVCKYRLHWHIFGSAFTKAFAILCVVIPFAADRLVAVH